MTTIQLCVSFNSIIPSNMLVSICSLDNQRTKDKEKKKEKDDSKATAASSDDTVTPDFRKSSSYGRKEEGWA